ncbi:DUF930 domain-containing protein [Microvirga roseola]|uniref:DUF930 domain-containing protein n=1 Tax=Microvirga roseola TaxID=2883126 RepID=UPI001E636800|nr:DUF930 domain-containing protein [Microvirga roseola]
MFPDPLPADTAPRVIRATRILSGDVLAHPGSRKMREALSQMEEGTRLEQLCNIEAMAQIAAALGHFRPEQVVAYAMADTRVTRTAITARGAAFRSGREWLNLAYECQLTPDRTTVRGFAFSVGAAIPE